MRSRCLRGRAAGVAQGRGWVICLLRRPPPPPRPHIVTGIVATRVFRTVT